MSLDITTIQRYKMFVIRAASEHNPGGLDSKRTNPKFHEFCGIPAPLWNRQFSNKRGVDPTVIDTLGGAFPCVREWLQDTTLDGQIIQIHGNDDPGLLRLRSAPRSVLQGLAWRSTWGPSYMHTGRLNLQGLLDSQSDTTENRVPESVKLILQPKNELCLSIYFEILNGKKLERYVMQNIWKFDLLQTVISLTGNLKILPEEVKNQISLPGGGPRGKRFRGRGKLREAGTNCAPRINFIPANKR